ncbi:MAG: hypothetical protein HFJ26_01780 [Clostridia bacterium]|nr:hypothetical protein [Clostridia bacterium]
MLAMNGTEHSVGFLSKTIDITDTEAILETMNKYSLGLVALRNFSSIFMGFFQGKPFVVADNTVNIKVLNNNNTKALVFASDFPTKFRSNIYEATERFNWHNEGLPDILIKYKKRYYSTRYFNDYEYHNDLYGQCYLEALEKRSV